MPSRLPSSATRGALAALFLAAASGVWAADLDKHVEPNWAELKQLPLIQLNPPPAWTPAKATWSIDDLEQEFKQVTDRPPPISSEAGLFVRADHQWLLAFTKWFLGLQKSLKLEYKNEVWDCDDYARCFVAFADMAATSAGAAKGTICAGWASVFNRFAFGDIGGSNLGGHAVVIVGTSEGLFVIEPQTGKMAPLRSYPNRDEFQQVNL